MLYISYTPIYYHTISPYPSIGFGSNLWYGYSSHINLTVASIQHGHTHIYRWRMCGGLLWLYNVTLFGLLIIQKLITHTAHINCVFDSNHRLLHISISMGIIIYGHSAYIYSGVIWHIHDTLIKTQKRNWFEINYLHASRIEIQYFGCVKLEVCILDFN